MTYVYFMSVVVTVGVCVNVGCIAAVVKDTGVLSLEVWNCIVCLCKGVMYVVFLFVL